MKILSNNSEVKAIFEPLGFAFFAHMYQNLFTFEHLQDVMTKEPFTDDNMVWKDVPVFVENYDFGKWIRDKSVKHILLIRDPLDVAMSTIGFKGFT